MLFLKPHLTILIRNFWPQIWIWGSLAWISYRTIRLFTSSDWSTDATILESWLYWVDQCKQLVWYRILDLSDNQNDSNHFFRTMIAFGFKLLHDVFGIVLLLTSIRISYCISHFTWSEVRTMIEDALFEWAKQNVGAISRKIDNEIENRTTDMAKAYGRDNLQGEKLTSMPQDGRNPWLVFHELAEHASREHASSWQCGKLSGTVYVADEQHIQLMNEVYGLYSVANTLHPGVWPKLTQCESELIAMTSDILHGTGVGCTSSGGTESIMLAIKAHWVHYGRQRGIMHPELVCGSTAHASVDKACEIMGIRKVSIDCNNAAMNYTLCPKQVERHITTNTIMIFASAPNYPQGTIDPIEDLGTIAERYNIGLHVDACLGGFVLPFARPGTFPTFDFQIPGVTSMSTDTHKFGYSPKGTSVVLYRDKQLRHAQYFSYARWTGGIYITPTFAGSRPSALIGCAWASLVTLGREGFQQRTQQLLTASETIAQAIRIEIPELFVLGSESQVTTMVVCFGSKDFNIYRISDLMQGKGWSLNSLQNPASIHLCVTLPVAPYAHNFVNDLKEVVGQLRQEEAEHSIMDGSSKPTKQGTAGIYGMSGSLPEGPVNDLLKAFVDVGLTP